ncbi:MAG: SH3 domain-containing protein [Clostridiales bacterium]|nr:SH3 domain-containing protein [Clostridiales bacterium]
MKQIIIVVGLMVLSILLIGCETNEVKSTDIMQVQDFDDNETEQKLNPDVGVTETILSRVKVMVDVLNLRETPTVSSEKIGEVYLSSVYEVIESLTVNDEVWYKISAGDHFGWIASWFCEETFLEAYEVVKLNESGLILDNYYEIGSSVILEDHIQTQYSYEIFMNGHPIEETFTFLSEGDYEYYTVLYDELGRKLSTGKKQLKVVENKDTLCYKSPDMTSEVTYHISDISEYNNVFGVIYDYDETLEIWYELYPPNEEKCYFLRTESIEVRNSFDHVVFKFNDEKYEVEGEYLVPNRTLEDFGYFIFEGESLFIVNVKTGKSFKTSYSYHFIDDDFLIVYKDIDQYINDLEQEYSNLRIYDLVDGNFELLYEDQTAYIGIEHQGYEDNILTFGGYGRSRNDWDFAAENLLQETIQLQRVDDTWHRQIKSSDYNHTNPSSLMTVYNTQNQLSEVIDIFDIHEVQSVTFLQTYDIIDHQLVLWFQVTLKDGTIGYTYRSRLPHEPGYLLNLEDYYMTMADGSKLKKKSSSDFWYVKTHLRDELAEFNMYLTSESYEGTTLKAYDRLTKEKVELPFNNTVLLSPNKTWLLGTLGYYADPESKVMIFEYKDNEFHELYKLELNQIYAYNFEWLTDDSLSFILGDRDNKYDALLELINDEWVLTTECPNL